MRTEQVWPQQRPQVKGRTLHHQASWGTETVSGLIFPPNLSRVPRHLAEGPRCLQREPRRGLRAAGRSQTQTGRALCSQEGAPHLRVMVPRRDGPEGSARYPAAPRTRGAGVSVAPVLVALQETRRAGHALPCPGTGTAQVPCLTKLDRVARELLF